MKKLVITFLSLMILSSASVYAAGIEVLPTMQSRSNAQDRVWVGTFQIVWNEFIDNVIHMPVRFREGTPASVLELNKQTFTETDLSDNSYYKMTGKVTKRTKKQIAKAIKRKFNETSDILDQIEWNPKEEKLLLYAMLKKDFEFINEFEVLEKAPFGQNQEADYFGISKRNKELASGVEVLFYNSEDDFAVKLKTKDKDEVYLYKTPSNKAFNYLWQDILKKQASFKGITRFKDNDELKVPNIKFSEEKIFDEVTNKRIKGTNLYIDKAMETIKFDMNNKGVELKSEAAMSVATCSLPAPEELIPRLFNFDDTFVLFLKETGKSSPYFALRVHDITKYQD